MLGGFGSEVVDVLRKVVAGRLERDTLQERATERSEVPVDLERADYSRVVDGLHLTWRDLVEEIECDERE